MALVAKITNVTHEVTHEDDHGNPTTTDLSLSGRYQVQVDYYDDANPQTILLTHSFEFPVNLSEQEARDHIIAFGQRIRDARVRVNQLKVYEGAVLPLDE